MDIKQVAAALVKAKREFAPALKTSLNQHFKSKYADLSSCIEAVDGALLNHGLAMYQETFLDEVGVTVETVFLHESGESIRCGKLHVPAAKHDPQGFGSALSYCRRYSLMTACGIAPEDDDGNAASGNATSGNVATPAKPKVLTPPAKVEGKGGAWNLAITADKGADTNTWVDVVYDLTSKALGLAKNDADVMEIFKVNRGVFDQLKSLNEDSYKNLMAAFTETKNNFKKA